MTGLTQSFDSRNAGSRNLLVSAYSVNDGNGGGNYTVATTTALGTITPAQLLLAATTESRVYNGTTASSATPTATGLVGGDSVAGLTQSFDSRNAGNRSLAVGGGYTVNDGNGGANYAWRRPPPRQHHNGATDPGRDADSKVYDGGTGSAAAPTATGLVAGDSVGGLRQAFDSRNAGSRNLVVTGYTINDGNGGADYALTTVAASGQIDRATLIVSAATETKVYDEEGEPRFGRNAGRRVGPGARATASPA